MSSLNIGDIVTRRSYNDDIYFRITDIKKHADGTQSYVLKGLLYRLHADSSLNDLAKSNPQDAYLDTTRSVVNARKYASQNFIFSIPILKMFRSRVGKILHFDADEKFLKICMDHYKRLQIDAVGKLCDESEQPGVVGRFLEKYTPDIVVLTGHDGIKKDTDDLYSLDNYQNSRYFVESVKEARKYEQNFDKLCIFSGACQSYFEAIMDAGANFASAPGRVLINALDPAIVSKTIALTDYRTIVSPREIAKITISGSKGIGGIKTRGHWMK